MSSDLTRYHERVCQKGKCADHTRSPARPTPEPSTTYWVYVPAQYDPAVAASLMILNDGQAFKNMEGDVRAPNVFDNLIHRCEIPVMLAVFINPGRTPEQPEPTLQEWSPHHESRDGYNTLDDKYARVIADELIPALNKDYNISKDPEWRGIGGASSGAIAAFTVAWHRPNEFRKVLSIVGSFTNLRGGDAYAGLVRSNEKKPIRIYLQDGRNDNRGVGGDGKYDERRDWFLQNVRLDEGAHGQRIRGQLHVGNRAARPEAGGRDLSGYDALALARPSRLG